MSNALAALGGIASGLASGLQRKQDQQREQDQKHQDLVNQLVVNGITSGKVSDPEQAFKFLMNSGKPGGKDLPPAVSSMIGSVIQHARSQPQAQTPDTSLPPLPVQPGQPYDPSKDPNASQYSATGKVSGGPAPAPVLAPGSAPAPDTGTEAGDGQASTGTPSASPISAGASVPASQPAPGTSPTPVVPGRSLNPMGGWKTTKQLADEEVERKTREVSASDMAKYESQVAVVKRMVANGVVPDMRTGFQMLGIGRQPPVAGLAPRNIALPVPASNVPPAALTAQGDPFPFNKIEDGTIKYVQKSQVHVGYNADGSVRWETRWDPSGAPASVTAAAAKAQTVPLDPAKFRERVAEIKNANPNMSDADVRKKAGETLQAEAQTAAGLAKTRADTAAEAAGTKAGVYDDLPDVTQGSDGRPVPEEQAQFEQQIKEKPKGDILLQNIKKASQYKMPASDFTSRQIGGLNRATFVGLVTKYDPSFDETKYRPRQEMMNSWQGDGKTAQVMQSARKIVNHLSDFSKANEELDAVSSNYVGGMLNQPLIGAERLGIIGKKGVAEKAQKALRDYQVAQNAVAEELRKFYAPGGGGGSVEEVNKWLQLSNPYGTSTERRAFLREGAHLMIGQVVPKVQAYQQVIGDLPPGNLWLNNQDRLKLRAMGVDVSDLPATPEAANKAPNPAEANLPPEIQGLAPGMKATLPDGRVFYRDANGVLRGGTTVPPKK